MEGIMRENCRKFITVPFILEILLFIQIKGFVIMDNGQLGGTHWTNFCINEKKHCILIAWVALLKRFT